MPAAKAGTHLKNELVLTLYGAFAIKDLLVKICTTILRFPFYDLICQMVLKKVIKSASFELTQKNLIQSLHGSKSV